MFIAHLPAGYLVGRGFSGSGLRGVVAAAMLGSIFPDLDLFYFYLVDGRQTHHHAYWVHYPLLWLVVLAGCLVWLYCRRGSRWAGVSVVFTVSVLVHLALDLVAGDVMLLAPFSREFYSLVTVEAVYKPWWLNFVLHWTFVVELLITGAAVAVFVVSRRRRKRETVGRTGVVRAS